MRVSVCVYMWVSVCIAGLALCSVAQFWLNKENTVGPMKCQGLGGTNIEKWEDESEGERGREAWVVKAPQLKLHIPLWISCVITCVFVCACMYVCMCKFVPKSVFFPLWCHYRLSHSHGSPCLPSVISELSPRDSCIRHHHSDQETQWASLDVTFKRSSFSIQLISDI